MATLANTDSKFPVVCRRCHQPVDYSHDMHTDRTVVRPCPSCLRVTEQKAIQSAAEEIGQLRSQLNAGTKENWKQGYKEGWEAAMKYCDNH